MAPRAALILVLSLPLAACIPPSANFPTEREPVTRGDLKDPQLLLETDMTILSGEHPVWQVEPVTASARTVASGTHIVQPGETLSGIAERYGLGLSTMAEVNSLSSPYAIRIGQRLSIPQGKFHIIEAGDTGIGIARAYQVKWSDVIAANNLSEPFVLKIGQRLRIPEGTAPETTSAPMLAVETGSSFTLDLDDILTGSEPAELPQENIANLPPLSGPQIPVRAPATFTGSFSWPVAGQLVGKYGPAGEGKFNSGLEIATVPAAPIRASADGVVAYVGNNVAGFGGMIMIRHGADWITTYGRAASTAVRRGQTVKKGEIIGSTGNGTRPQLNFGLRKGRSSIDPLSKLPPL